MRAANFNLICILLLGCSCVQQLAAGSSSSPSSILLRVRLPDGSVERLQVSSSELTLKDALKPLNQPLEDLSIQSGTESLDPSRALPELGIKHGALITLRSPSSATSQQTTATTTTTKEQHKQKFNPYPELAKDYSSALRRHQRQRRSSNSFAALAELREELHVVEPQAASTVQRLYMCAPSAERFFQQSSSQQQQPALLLGTLVRERKEPRRRPKTSLSSTTEPDEMCVAAKVHAIYQNNKKGFYDNAKARQVASWLGLRPIGWVFSYANDRHANDGLPVHVHEILQAAQGQMQHMQQQYDPYPNAWLTCAMDATTGATEVFQLSDVTVQMVAEDMIQSPTKNQRQAHTRHPVVVQGQEVRDFDSVLCLVNTALLSHTGWYGASAAAVSAKTGLLTKKARKALRQALATRDNSTLLSQLCSFSTLLALYEEGLSEKDCQALCRVVQKWARGQKKGTQVDEALRGRLEKLVELP